MTLINPELFSEARNLKKKSKTYYQYISDTSEEWGKIDLLFTSNG